jgi:hypothetical protein
MRLWAKDQYGDTALRDAIAQRYIKYLMLLLDRSDGGNPASAETIAHALGAVLESEEEEFSASAAFMVLAQTSTLC